MIVLSGGQTGVDQAALRAAKACGIAIGGYAPKDWATEDGPAPWLADYGLVECEASGYPARTRKNVESADWLLWLGDPKSPGGRLTIDHALSRYVSITIIDSRRFSPKDARAMMPDPLPEGFRLLVAGNRESSNPGIGARAEAWLVEFFKELTR